MLFTTKVASSLGVFTSQIQVESETRRRIPISEVELQNSTVPLYCTAGCAAESYSPSDPAPRPVHPRGSCWPAHSSSEENTLASLPSV